MQIAGVTPTEFVLASDFDALHAERDALEARVRELEGYISEGRVHKLNDVLRTRLTTAEGVLERAVLYVDDDSTDLREQIRAWLTPETKEE